MSDTDPRPESGDAEAQDLYGVTAGQVATLRDALDRHDRGRARHRHEGPEPG